MLAAGSREQMDWLHRAEESSVLLQKYARGSLTRKVHCASPKSMRLDDTQSRTSPVPSSIHSNPHPSPSPTYKEDPPATTKLNEPPKAVSAPESTITAPPATSSIVLPLSTSIRRLTIQVLETVITQAEPELKESAFYVSYQYFDSRFPALSALRSPSRSAPDGSVWIDLAHSATLCINCADAELDTYLRTQQLEIKLWSAPVFSNQSERFLGSISVNLASLGSTLKAKDGPHWVGGMYPVSAPLVVESSRRATMRVFVGLDVEGAGSQKTKIEKIMNEAEHVRKQPVHSVSTHVLPPQDTNQRKQVNASVQPTHEKAVNLAKDVEDPDKAEEEGTLEQEIYASTDNGEENSQQGRRHFTTFRSWEQRLERLGKKSAAVTAFTPEDPYQEALVLHAEWRAKSARQKGLNMFAPAPNPTSTSISARKTVSMSPTLAASVPTVNSAELHEMHENYNVYEPTNSAVEDTLSLKITIERALNLPTLLASQHDHPDFTSTPGHFSEPNCYILYHLRRKDREKGPFGFTRTSDMDVHGTPVVSSSSPKWNVSKTFYLSSISQHKWQEVGKVELELQAWHRQKSVPVDWNPAQEHDPEDALLIGSALVELSPLAAGFKEISGWYHLFDFKKQPQGQVKVVVQPQGLLLDQIEGHNYKVKGYSVSVPSRAPVSPEPESMRPSLDSSNDGVCCCSACDCSNIGCEACAQTCTHTLQVAGTRLLLPADGLRDDESSLEPDSAPSSFFTDADSAEELKNTLSSPDRLSSFGMSDSSAEDIAGDYPILPREEMDSMLSSGSSDLSVLQQTISELDRVQDRLLRRSPSVVSTSTGNSEKEAILFRGSSNSSRGASISGEGTEETSSKNSPSDDSWNPSLEQLAAVQKATTLSAHDVEDTGSVVHSIIDEYAASDSSYSRIHGEIPSGTPTRIRTKPIFTKSPMSLRASNYSKATVSSVGDSLDPLESSNSSVVDNSDIGAEDFGSASAAVIDNSMGIDPDSSDSVSKRILGSTDSLSNSHTSCGYMTSDENNLTQFSSSIESPWVSTNSDSFADASTTIVTAAYTATDTVDTNDRRSPSSSYTSSTYKFHRTDDSMSTTSHESGNAGSSSSSQLEELSQGDTSSLNTTASDPDNATESGKVSSTSPERDIGRSMEKLMVHTGHPESPTFIIPASTSLAAFVSDAPADKTAKVRAPENIDVCLTLRPSTSAHTNTRQLLGRTTSSVLRRHHTLRRHRASKVDETTHQEACPFPLSVLLSSPFKLSALPDPSMFRIQNIIIPTG